MTAPTLPQVATAEAEITILRAAAVRALMARGATHNEARAAVDEELRHGLVPAVRIDLGLNLAAAFRALSEAWDRILPVLMRAAAQLAERGLIEPAPAPTTVDDRVADLLARKRAGHGAGPRRDPHRRAYGRAA